MRLLHVFACVLALCACAAHATVGDAGHDLKYFDLPNMPITLKNGQDQSACQALCTQESKCMAWVFGINNCGGATQPLCWLKATANITIVVDQCKISGYKNNKLQARKFTPYPLGAIAPQGWLKNQLQIQGNGLTGHLSLFWASISESAWIGHPGGDSFERVPYWLNGIIPLAHQLNDATLHGQVEKYVDFILKNQQADGWIGPTCCDPWPRFPLLLALMQYHEANPSEQRVIPAMTKFFTRLRAEIDKNPLTSWAQFRWQDLVLAIHWMIENAPQGETDWLIGFGHQVANQGFDWKGYFAGSSFPKGACNLNNECNMASHGVNVGQGLKSSTVYFRQSYDQSDLTSAKQRTDTLYKYHGLASGIFSCSEHLAGNHPSQGSELCTVVETMYSFEEMFSVTGDNMYADMIEMLTFNAMPATMTSDMWAHQYLQQSNEIDAQHVDPHIYVTDGPDSNIYGLEPNFGCCTANYHQGWPKFATHLFMATADNGIIAVLYSPSTLTTTVSGKAVEISLVTEYPFDGLLTFSVKSETAFPFYLRIPGWASSATVQVAGGASQKATAGQNFLVSIKSGTTSVVLNLNPEFYVTRRYNNAASIYWGTLLLSVNIDAVWKVLNKYAYNSTDLQATPAGNWAFGIQLSQSNPASSLKLQKRPIGYAPFSASGSPIVVTAQGAAIDGWSVSLNAAAAPPTSPVKSSHPLQTLTLLPFGATKLRLAEIPTLN